MSQRTQFKELPSRLWSRVVRIWSVLKDLGLTGFVASTTIAGLVAVIAWLHDMLPLSIVVCLGFAVFAVFAFSYRQVVEANKVSRFDPKKFRDLGRQMKTFSRGAIQFLNDWDRHHPHEPQNLDDTKFDRSHWESERRREYNRAAAFTEHHMGTAISFLATLEGIGVYPPFHTVAGARSRPDGLLVYLAAAGDLLEAGYIEEARALNGREPEEARIGSMFHLLG